MAAVTMSEVDKLAAIEGLHSDLIAVSQGQFSEIDRLLADLDSHVEALRKLLDRTAKSTESRNQLASGKITIGEDEYELNEEFKNSATELSDALGINETEACQLLFEAQSAAQALNRTPVATAVIRFQAYRTYLAESVRILLGIVLNEDINDDVREQLKIRLEKVIQSPGEKKSGSKWMQKCLGSMLEIEQWLNKIAEQIQKMITVGQLSSADQDEVIGIQQQHLTLQHESLAGIVTYLTKMNHTSIDDLKKLLKQLQQLDKWNNLAIHYVPVIIALFSIYGSAHGSVTHGDSRTIHKSLLEALDGSNWPLRQFQGAVVVWWLAEYNSWYFDMPDENIATGDEDKEKEVKNRKDALTKALGNGAFQSMLSICSQISSGDWYDTTRLGLIRTLLNDAYTLPQESAAVSDWFVQVLFEHLTTFTISFIQNMPDTLREFKINEEDQRRNYISTLSANLQNDIQQPDRHLERFFLIMSYAYEGRSEAAIEFWGELDGAMHGFLQWFSRRVSTPLVSAFCEMFRSISQGEEYATAAHHFLSDANSAAMSRARKASSLSWEQIFEELEFYATKVRDSPIPAIATTNYGPPKPRIVDVDEPETPVMLECYLRLIAHLCDNSGTVRNYILTQTRCKIIDTVFALSNSTVPSRIRACAYKVMSGLLEARTIEISHTIWLALDQWVASGFPSTRPSRINNAGSWAGEYTFSVVASDYEEMASFVDLMNALVRPPQGNTMYDSLTFPESLGSAYRMPGIDNYIDFILGELLANKAMSFDAMKARILCSKIFMFVRIVFESFNEKLLTLAQRTGQSIDEAIEASSLTAYIQLHPFSRVMEWMFNEKVLTVVFQMAHQDISEISSTSPSAPINAALLGSIEVMNLIMQLQTTYLDVVRPLIKTQSTVRRQPVSNPSLASFEDAVSVNLRVITDLAYYAGQQDEMLALPSLQLLKQFSRSRKLNSTSTSRISSQVLSNRLIGILQSNNDTTPISKALGDLLDWDERELEGGSGSPRFRIKFAILDFIQETLNANAEIPNIGHALLGFDCTSLSLSTDTEEWAEQRSLFHKVASLGLRYPSAENGSFEIALLDLKTKALSIIHRLWTANLTSALVLPALTLFPYLDLLWASTPVISPATLWQNFTYQEQEFIFSDGVRAFECFLKQRNFLYSHVASQIRLFSSQDSLTARSQLLSTTFGVSSIGEENEACATIFDFLDFLELDISYPLPDISVEFLEVMGDPESYASCIVNDVHGTSRYDLSILEQYLTLKGNQFHKMLQVVDAAVEEKLSRARKDILGYFDGVNNHKAAERARISALKSWTDLLVIIIQQGGLSESDKASVIIQALQIVSPKLELFATANRPETQIFASLVQVLVAELDLESTTLAAGRAGDMARERLFELFKICLRAISNPDTLSKLRESFYDVCYRYITSVGSQSEHHRTETMQAIRAAGDVVVEIISEDAYGSAGASSIGALLFLDAIARLATEDNSSYVIESLARNNFVSVLVESIASILPELDRATKAELPLLLTNYHAKLALLLSLSSTRTGANKIVSAGLFSSIRASQLFSTDPDLGLDLDNPSALKHFYELVLALLRIVAAVVISRGAQNKQTTDQARGFLQENRALMIGILKRESKVVKYAQEVKNPDEKGTLEGVLDQLVEVYCVLIAATRYLEFEDESAKNRSSVRGRFS